MKILALEFCSSQRSVAVLVLDSAGKVLAEAEVIESGGRTTRAIGMIETALRQAQVEREQIDRLAVGLGPGSYHGIRTAVALAQGWQLARKVDVLGLSSADVLAEHARLNGVTGEIHIAIDAQRNEFYIARYSIAPDCISELEPLHLAARQEIDSSLAQSATFLGPDLTTSLPGASPLFPTAATLARLSVTRSPIRDSANLEPIYLRPTAFVKAAPPTFCSSPASPRPRGESRSSS